MKRGLFFCILLLAVVALPVLAASPIDRVPAGLDYWQTLSSGATAYDFSNNAIPAGFFCNGSAPFKGRVNFEGVPIHTEPAGILGTTDTVIERLDEAVFDDGGTARTRIRGRVLNLQGTELLKNACGQFKVTARLTHDQPTSPMIFHAANQYGGTFDAQLRLRVQVSFTDVRTKRTLSLVRDVYLPTVNNTPFAIGKAAQLACASTTTVGATSVRLDDGQILGPTPRPAGSAGKRATTGPGDTVEPIGPAQPIDGGGVVTGCQCNSSGQCLPTYSWHDPCAGETLEKCEQHFTHTPCQLGYTNQPCTATPALDSYLNQLKVLHDRGYITDSPEVALRKQLRSAAQIEKDQAAREREQANQQ
jgi:hypothetical protein